MQRHSDFAAPTRPRASAGRVSVGCLAFAALMASAGVAHGQVTAREETAGVLQDARRLRAKGRLDTALELLKRAQALAPEDEHVAVALAWAYLEKGNKFWALRTVSSYGEEHPEGCAARALTIWIHLEMANLDQADELLAQPGCDGRPEDRARFTVLRALLAEGRSDPRAAARYAEETPTDRLYAEDAPLLDRLLDKYRPGRLPVLSTRLELAAGFTSNGLAGSPVDATNPIDNPGSGLVVVDARLRAVIPATRSVRPVLSGQLRFFELTGGPARDLSYQQPTLRAGVLLGARHPRLLLSYAFDAVRLQGGDRYGPGPLWYSEAHRAEWEWEASRDVMAFGGLGSRRFRDMARTRFEVEQGLASAWLPHPSVRVLGAVSARWHQASSDAYDLLGGTALAELDWKLGTALTLRLNLAVSADWYPESRGYFGGSRSEPRRDLLERSTFGLWYKLAEGLQLGPSYELSHRTSTAEAYSFVDHRVLGRLVWTFDPHRYSVTAQDGRAKMEWSRPEAHGTHDDSRIQELLRQDDAVKRGSSCLK